MKIKVCGMRDRDNIAELVQLPVDYIGFIYYPPSPRYVGNVIGKEVLDVIPSGIKKTGVFVNAPVTEVIRIATENKLDCIQLHGNETPDFCQFIKEKGFEVIKAFKAEPEMLNCATTNYKYSCNYFLFDTPTANYGGSGRKFNWEILKQQHLSLPFFLSGGIGPDDAEILRKMDQTGLYAIDINSKFEIEPGLKDVEKIKQFIDKLL